jgi:hypothetical protein
MNTARRSVLAAALMLFAVIPAFSISLDGMDVNASLLVIGTDTTIGAAPSPILWSLGVSFPFSVWGPFFMEPGIGLFMQDYAERSGRVVPIEMEQNAFFAIGSILGMQAGARIALAPGLDMGMSVGLDTLLRFPIFAYYGESSAVQAMSDAWPYFYGAGRFLYPETRLFMRWELVKSMALVFSVRAFYPVSHLWDGLGLSFWEDFMISGTLGFSIRLGESAAQQAAPASDQPASGSPEAPPAPSS